MAQNIVTEVDAARLFSSETQGIMNINEIFFSIQGESSYTGMPCIFIRLTGCNLRCTWCDTAYAFYEGAEMGIDSIMIQLKKYQCSLVEVTGGEPLMQEGVFELVDRLVEAGYTVLVETGGSISLGRLNPNAIKIMDIKCPGSKMHSRMDFSNIPLLSRRDEVKFVLLDRKDYEYAKEIIATYDLLNKTNVHFSPVHGELATQTLAEWILNDGLSVRLQIQLHKYIWGKDTRGV